MQICESLTARGRIKARHEQCGLAQSEQGLPFACEDLMMIHGIIVV